MISNKGLQWLMKRLASEAQKGSHSKTVVSHSLRKILLLHTYTYRQTSTHDNGQGAIVQCWFYASSPGNQVGAPQHQLRELGTSVRQTLKPSKILA